MGRLILALVLVLTPVLAEASTPNWHVEIGGGSHWVTDPSYDLVSTSDMSAAFVLAAGWTPGWLEDRLAFRLGYRASSARSRVFATWTADFNLASFDAGARYDFASAGRAKAFARGALLVDIAALDISAGDSSVAATAFGAGVTAALGGEWSFHQPTSEAGVRFSILIEAGWSQRFTKARFDVSAPADHQSTGPAPIESVPVNVGDIGLSGAFAQAAAVVRF